MTLSTWKLLLKQKTNNVEDKEIIKEIIYLVDSEPHNETLGSKIRSFINQLDDEIDVEVYDGLRTWKG